MRFVLAGSGHIAGVINPPQANKYYFYRNPERPTSADEWLDSAFKVEGSWWPDWLAWEDGVSGPMVPARTIDSTVVIEPAPGRYVQQRLDSRPVSDRAAA